MQSSIIIRKNNHWYVLPAGADENKLILDLVQRENPELQLDNSVSIAEQLEGAGWSVENYRDFSVAG